MRRYLEGLSNLILTDYLEFRWYVSGKHRLTARLATATKNKLKADKKGATAVSELVKAFLNAQVPTIANPKELAVKMAALARLIRDTINRAWAVVESVPPEVWSFTSAVIRWLKDRKGRQLTYDDLTHYQHIVAALSQTIRLMHEIDESIEQAGGFPIQ
jgi:hypothetical protein